MKKFIPIGVSGIHTMAPGPALRRRALLSGSAGMLAATSGCVGELRNLLGRESTQQLSLNIVTTPAANDPYAVRVANRLADRLEQAGIAAFVDLLSPDVLLRDVLINQDFDIYVARYPSVGSPDELRTLLHSSYGEEAGWQNPFGFSDLSVDELLAEQRTSKGERRLEAIHEIQREIAREQPFTPLAFPDRITGFRDERFGRWPEGGPQKLTDYLSLERTGDADDIEMLLLDPRSTRNQNPIAAEYRSAGHLIDLLYEPLVRTPSEESDSIPWLARSVAFEDDPLTALVELRDASWHDGESITAEDVVFTYEFLTDTSMGGFDTPVPTPWRRGQVSLVESVEAVDAETVRFEFTTTTPEVAIRAFRLAILPAHVWRERTDQADLAGIDIGGATTEAVVSSNNDPVGSGPLRVESATADGELLLSTFDGHFLFDADTEDIPETFTEVPFERARFTVAPSDDAAVQLLEADDADSTAHSLGASVAPRIGRADEVSLGISQSDDFYHLGYNCRNAPLSDPNFRRTIARMLDRETLVSDSFGGFAEPTETPLKERWTPEKLRWDGKASLPFFGSDGEFDVTAARDAFREAGYHYEDDQFVRRGES